MLSEKPQNLWEEVRAAEEARDRYLRNFREQIRRLVGPAYDEECETGYVENVNFEYLSIFLGTVAMAHPRLRLKSALGGPHQSIAIGLKHGFNRWARQTDARGALELLATDMAFNLGVLLSVTEPRIVGGGRGEDDNVWPRWYRVPQRWFFMDPRATSMRTTRFRGHKYPIGKDDLLKLTGDESEGWKRDAIEQVAEEYGVDELYDAGQGDEGGASPRRGEIVVREVWVPEHIDEKDGPKDGYNGMIYTLCPGGEGGDGLFIREPQPAFGPAWGRYAIAGAYSVPDNPFPMSPLTAVETAMVELNDQADAANRSAREYKRLVICSSDNPQLAAQLNETPDSYVIQVPGFSRDQVEVVEIGGTTDQQRMQVAEARDRLGRQLGQSEAMAGRPEGDVKATADAIAARAGATRINFVRGKFVDALNQAARTVLWDMAWDKRFTVSLDDDPLEDMGVDPEKSDIEAVYFHGGDAYENGIPMDDLIADAEIEWNSVGRDDDAIAIEQAVTVLEVASNVLGLAAEFPNAADWKTVIGRIGDRINEPDLGSLFNPEGAAQDQMAAQEPGGMAGGAAPKPVRSPSRPPRRGASGGGFGPPTRTQSQTASKGRAQTQEA